MGAGLIRHKKRYKRLYNFISQLNGRQTSANRLLLYPFHALMFKFFRCFALFQCGGGFVTPAIEPCRTVTSSTVPRHLPMDTFMTSCILGPV